MIAVALKGLAGRKVRALLTALAVVIGISMVSGTYILTDTMQKSFDGLFAPPTTRPTPSSRPRRSSRARRHQSGTATIPAALLAKVQALPEVEAAGGAVSPGRGQRGRHHRPRRQARRPRERRRQLSTPTIASSARSSSSRASGPRARSRSSSTPAPPPSSTTSSATRSRSRRSAPSTPTRSPASSPTATSTRSASPASRPGTSKTAQKLLHREGGFDSISISAAKGTSSAELVRAVTAARARPACRSRTAPSRPRTTPTSSTAACRS